MKVGARIFDRLRRDLGECCPLDILQIADLQLFRGPSPHAPGPALICHLLVGQPLPSAAIMAERLRSILPDDLPMPAADDGQDNGMTAFALAESIAGLTSSLLSASMGLDLVSGAAPASDEAAIAWVEFASEAAVLQAIRIALLAVGSSLTMNPLSASAVGKEITLLRRRWAPRGPSPESRLMIAAARAANIPVLRVSNSASIWQFGWGIRSELFWITSSNQDGVVGGLVARQKNYQKRLFENLGLPTPRWQRLPANADLMRAVRIVGFPCVVKPIDLGSGRGVTANIGNMEVLKRAVAMARRHSPLLMLEAHEPGHDHRLMVVNGKLEMALRLDPPKVIGDGRRTVHVLLEELNLQRDQDQTPGAPSQVPTDDSLDLALASQDLTLKSVPEAGRGVLLRTNANRSTGGTALNVLDKVHPHVRRYAELLAEATGLATVGIDYITTDIGRPHEEVGGGFLEINTTPGMARAVASGLVPAELARRILGTRPGRIPICLLIALEDQLERISAELRNHLPDSAGLVLPQSACLGATDLPKNKLRPVERVTALLRYRSLQSLTILWTEQELLESGMPVDALDKLIIMRPPAALEWQALLEKHAKTVVFAKDIEAAIQLVIDRQSDGGNAGTGAG